MRYLFALELLLWLLILAQQLRNFRCSCQRREQRLQQTINGESLANLLKFAQEMREANLIWQSLCCGTIYIAILIIILKTHLIFTSSLLRTSFFFLILRSVLNFKQSKKTLEMFKKTAKEIKKKKETVTPSIAIKAYKNYQAFNQEKPRSRSEQEQFWKTYSELHPIMDTGLKYQEFPLLRRKTLNFWEEDTVIFSDDSYVTYDDEADEYTVEENWINDLDWYFGDEEDYVDLYKYSHPITGKTMRVIPIQHQTINSYFNQFPRCRLCRNAVLEIIRRKPFVCAIYPYGKQECEQFEKHS